MLPADAYTLHMNLRHFQTRLRLLGEQQTKERRYYQRRIKAIKARLFKDFQIIAD